MARKKKKEPVYLWSDEEGDRWFAEGHVEFDDMLAGAIDFEIECGETMEPHQFATQVIHRWKKTDPENPEEEFLFCGQSDEGAEPITVLERA